MCTDHLSPRMVLSWLWACLRVTYLVPMCISVACAQTLVLGAANSTPTAFIENGRQAGILVDVINEANRLSDSNRPHALGTLPCRSQGGQDRWDFFRLSQQRARRVLDLCR